MDGIDKIVFGDNQFFGINHMSQEKAQELSEKFYNIDNIYKIYDIAFSNGIRAVMLNSNDRAKEICNYFRDNKSKYGGISWYPSIPYPHKYANIVAEKGLLSAINEILLSKKSTTSAFGLLAKGGIALVNKDMVKLMQMLVDLEFDIYKGLNVRCLFLQNVVVDLLLGLGLHDIFESYCEYVRKKYKILPGFITMNMPYLKSKFDEWGIKEVVICSSINKIGYFMSPSVDSYMTIIKNNNPSDYQLMAMSTLASGAIRPLEAYDFINTLNIQSVVFGASSEKNIKETIGLINI